MKSKAKRPAASSRDDLDWAIHAGVSEEILSGLETRAKVRRKRRAILGAAFALVMVGAVFLQIRRDPQVELASAPPVIESFAVVQPRVQTLDDGSIVELKDDAEITVSFSEKQRRVSLLRGAAHFAVAKNPARPFIVSSNGVEVRAVGTAFAVVSGAQSVEVLVTEGKVAVETAHTEVPSETESRLLASMTAGHRTVVQTESQNVPQVEAISDDGIRASLSWRIPRLEFSGTPLSVVVDELNKRNRTQLVVADERIGRFQISGTLRADRLDPLIEMLAADFGISAERLGERIVLRPQK